MYKCVVEIVREYYKLNGNAKNSEVKRFTKMLNTTWVKERWFLLAVISSMIIYHEVNEQKRKNDTHKNEERRKEEEYKIKMKNIFEEVNHE